MYYLIAAFVVFVLWVIWGERRDDRLFDAHMEEIRDRMAQAKLNRERRRNSK